MISLLQPLEKSLDNVYKDAPKLPPNFIKTLVNVLPWINLVLGILSLWGALALWNWAHVANNYINYANSISAAYGGPTVATQRLTVTVWAALVVLTIEAVIYLAAFPATKARKKSGWDLMFYALAINVVYGLVTLFTDYGGVGNFLGSLIGTAIGLYFLYQIRSSYQKSAPTTAHKA